MSDSDEKFEKIAGCYYDKNEYDLAIKFFNKMSDSDNKFKDIGNFYYNDKKYDLAIE